MVKDSEIVAQINELADQERQLEEAHVGTGLSPEEQDRLRSLEVALDQCWDLLRQRRARRSAGGDPEQATVRPGPTVEDYRQ